VIRSGGIAAALIVTLAGCVGVVSDPGREGPAPQLGPQLVVEVVNNGERDVTLSYEFEAGTAGGGGEGMVGGCEHLSLSFGDVAGRFEVMIDGVQAMSGAVPAGAPARGYLALRVVVHPQGAVEAVGPMRWTETEPPVVSRRIGDCG